METAEFLRALLAADIVAVAVLALFYLRQRHLTWKEYLLWGILALTLPLLGPFLVILNRPGGWRSRGAWRPSDPISGPRILALVAPRRRIHRRTPSVVERK